MDKLSARSSKPNLQRIGFVLASLVLLVFTSALAQAQKTLKIYTWADYLDPEIITEFEQKFNVEVVFNYFESDQLRDEELAAVAGRGYDLIMINSIQVERYSKRGWLDPIDWNAVPNAKHIDPRWSNAFAEVDTYGVPYFWGTMGIAYRKDLIPNGFDSWLDLFNPQEVLRDKIVMINDARELTAMALKASGHSANSSNGSHLKEARQLLLKQKPYVQQYSYPKLSEGSALLTSDVWVSTMYSGDAIALQGYDENIAFSLPKEGGLIWVDYLTVASSSNEKRLAHEFLNFLNEPKIASRSAEWVYYASPNLAAAQLMSEAYMSNTIINPSAAALGKSEFIQSLPPRSRKKVNSIGAELFRDSVNWPIGIH